VKKWRLAFLDFVMAAQALDFSFSIYNAFDISSKQGSLKKDE